MPVKPPEKAVPVSAPTEWMDFFEGVWFVFFVFG